MMLGFPADGVPSRRTFLRMSSVALALPAFSSSLEGQPAEESNTIVGPKSGYSPQIGTLVSEMAFMREQVLSSAKGLSQADLDFLLDAKANTIGALLLHLVATEKFYQLNTFQNLAMDKIPEPFKEQWGMPMELGEPARKGIKGHPLDYYLNALHETRETTLSEFRKRDDEWLLAVDKSWGWGPTNNYCKWFHVTEHEANHNGQIKLLKGRLPGTKSSSE